MAFQFPSFDGAVSTVYFHGRKTISYVASMAEASIVEHGGYLAQDSRHTLACVTNGLGEKLRQMTLLNHARHGSRGNDGLLGPEPSSIRGAVICACFLRHQASANEWLS